jgi:hypothetical protein
MIACTIAARRQGSHSSRGAPGATVSLLLRLRDNDVHVCMTSRMSPIDQIDERVLRSWTD